MIPFLSGFLKNLPAIQTKQLLRILSQRRDRGEIRTQADFVSELANLAALLSTSDIVQRTKALAYLEGDLLESDAARTTFENVRLDLEALLGETENLGNIVRAHHRILSENYFDALEAGLDELEAEVRAYEVLTIQKYSGFSRKVQSLNFSGAIAAAGADVSDPFITSLLSDARGGETLTLSPPKLGEIGLHLGISPEAGESSIRFDKIEILTDSTTPQTALSINTSGNVPDNAIDFDADTAWQHSILLDSHPSSCRLKVALSFISAERINALVIHPLASVPMKLMDISYIDSGGMEHSLQIGALHQTTAQSIGFGMKRYPLLKGLPKISDDEWILSNRIKTIPVGDIVARRIILTLQQDTAGDGEFYYYDSNVGDWKKDIAAQDAMRVFTLERGISILDMLGIFGESEDGVRHAAFVEYNFGIKNISCLEREYSPTGLFLPEAISIDAPSTLALYTDAEFPTDDATDIEFVLKKENYDSSGLLIDTEEVPFLPYGTGSVKERLFLKDRQSSSGLNNTGTLRFYPDFSQSFAIYGNSSALTLGVDYFISVDGGVTWESTLPPVGIPLSPMTCKVRIESPRTGTILVAEYTPLVSGEAEGSEVWLNSTRSVRLDRYQTYVFNKTRSYGDIVRCKLGLQILTRSNTLNTRVSPYLKEIVILGD